MKISIVYSGAFNYFEYTLKSQQKFLFNELDKLNIEYDIFANVGNHIEFRKYNYKNTEDWLNFHKSKECLNKHLPNKLIFKNSTVLADKILSKDKNYCKNVFRKI